MTAPLFVDSNVLIYAHDVRAGDRHDKAKALILELWRTRRGVLSAQVLQEFYVNITRKIPSPLARADARRLIQQYAVWPIQTVGAAEVLKASEIEEQYQISFWDALIVVAAQTSGAGALITEDLGSGRLLAGVAVINPFTDSQALDEALKQA
jgi:predicted nucleic acid-binding protein